MCRRPCSRSSSSKKSKMSAADTCSMPNGGMLQNNSPMYSDVSVPLATRLLVEQNQGGFNRHKKEHRSFDPFLLFSSCLDIRRSKRRKQDALIDSDAEDVRPYLDDSFVLERLMDTDMSLLVSLPNNVDRNEWLATHTFSFVEHVNLIYGCLSDYCQPSTCSTMSGPGNVKYQWIDERGKKSSKCSAPQYINHVMSNALRCIYNESVFPTKYGHAFPSTFEETVRRIHRLLLHVLAHIYQSHASTLKTLSLLACLNSVTHHFLLHSKQFNLIETLEMDVLDDLYDRLQSCASSPAILMESDTDHLMVGDGVPAIDNLSETISTATIHTTTTDWRESSMNERICKDINEEKTVHESFSSTISVMS